MKNIIAYFFKSVFYIFIISSLLLFLVSNMSYVNKQKSDAVKYMQAKK